MYRFFHLLVAISLILSSIAPASVASATTIASSTSPAALVNAKTATSVPSAVPQTASSALPAGYAAYLAPADAQPLMRAIPRDLPTLYGIAAEQQQDAGPYRTTVKVRGVADLARLKALGVTILNGTADSATIIVDRNQLEQVAKLNFYPRNTELTALLVAKSGGKLPQSATSIDVLAATALDSDNDGLNDTEEGWWCTLSNNADSDNDKVGDGAEVQALADWLQHKTLTRPASGKPFAGWPPDHTACNDSDYDSVPDAVEVYVFGLNPNRESTARDKFDDGQKLFGITNCPGSGGGCGYGALPRTDDWGVIFAEMPTWVKAPYDSPFVAAIPIPEVSVVPNSWTVERVTTITTQQGTMQQVSKSYETSVTRGQSTSIANTQTWNNWEEVSQAVSTPLGKSPSRGSPTGVVSPDGSATDFVSGSVLAAGGAVVGAVGAIGLTGGAGAAAIAAVPVIGACIASVVCGIALVAGGAIVAGVGTGLIGRSLSQDSVQTQNNINKLDIKNNSLLSNSSNNFSPSFSPKLNFSPSLNATINLGHQVDERGMIDSINGVQYAINQQGQLIAQGLHEISFAIAQPRLTETRTNGRPWGGAQTNTYSEHEDHTISQGEAFATAQNWSTAYAVDSSHAADLMFNFTVKNTGSELAKEISGIVFNIYLGDDDLPLVSYPAHQLFANGKLQNVFPGDVLTFGLPSGQKVPLSLDQMRRIDLGERLRVTLAAYSYGVDQLFYQDSINSGISVLIEDGVEDGDETVDRYILPTWGNESVQDVLRRYFSMGTDGDGFVNSLWTPESSGTGAPIWNEHFLSDIAWWNIYLTQPDADNTSLRDLFANAGSDMLFRFNRDSDRDGYTDRTEFEHHTDPHDANSHPAPSVIAGYFAIRSGNTMTVKLVVQNDGTFDTFGTQAVMFSPDSTTTIGNNTVGGNGHIRSGQHIAISSLIDQPELTHWTIGQGHAQPYAAGNFTGLQDRVYTFTVPSTAVAGNDALLNWTDGTTSGTVPLTSTYHSPLPINVGTEG